MSQRGIPVPEEGPNEIMIFLSQIFCRLRLCMIDISIPQLNMGFLSNPRWPPCKFGCENVLSIVKISAQNVYLKRFTYRYVLL